MLKLSCLTLTFPVRFVVALVTAVEPHPVWLQTTFQIIGKRPYRGSRNTIRHFLLAFLLAAMLLAVIPPVIAGSTTVLCSSARWRVDKNANAVRIFHKRGSQLPQYGALNLADSYFRLNYGPDSGWGTSIILLPSFWSQGIYYQGIPDDPITLTCSANDPSLILSISGTIAGLDVSEQVTLLPPTDTTIIGTVVTSVQGSIPLDNRPGEAFKPVMLSSMYISSTQWDTHRAYADSQSFPIPLSGWIIAPQPPVTASTFRLEGGTSAWKKNAPTVRINLSQPMQVAGWVTPTTNPNDDNVGLWAASDTLLSSYTYQIVVSRAAMLSLPDAPPRRNFPDDPTPTLTWSRVGWAVRYELQVSNYSGFIDAMTYQVGNILAFTFPLPLTDGTYYWRVRACSSALTTSCGFWSVADSFVADTLS